MTSSHGAHSNFIDARLGLVEVVNGGAVFFYEMKHQIERHNQEQHITLFFSLIQFIYSFVFDGL